jgi:TatA/E family protein of Tat protein translocase
MGHSGGMDVFCASLAFIDGLGAPEMVLIFVLVLVLFGGQKLPEFARGLGKSIREFKKAAAGVEEEFKRALEEDERKHATPQLPPPAPDPDPVPATPVTDHDQGGPTTDPHHPDTYHDTPVDEVPHDPAHATTEVTPSPSTEPTILPPAESPDPKSATTPKPASPPPANQYPENPS